MSTLRRILRYGPPVFLGLLIAVWLCGCLVRYGVAFAIPATGDEVLLEVHSGTVEFALNVYFLAEYGPYAQAQRVSIERMLGYFQLRYHSGLAGRPVMELDLPLPLLITLALPLAIGSAIGFRFRLWQYLAYTALVALELAYYLRWHG